MRENKGNGWVDRGPAAPTHLKSGYAGPVTASTPKERAEGHGRQYAPYDLETRKAIIIQGAERPRPLTAEETETADRNRRAFREYQEGVEAWARSEASA